MTIQEANALLDAVVPSNAPCRINPSMTISQAVEIIRKGLNSGTRALAADGIHLDPLFAKRVHQVTRNQSRPRF